MACASKRIILDYVMEYTMKCNAKCSMGCNTAKSRAKHHVVLPLQRACVTYVSNMQVFLGSTVVSIVALDLRQAFLYLRESRVQLPDLMLCADAGRRLASAARLCWQCIPHQPGI